MIRITNIKLDVRQVPTKAIKRVSLLKCITNQDRINDKDIMSLPIYKKTYYLEY